MKSVVIIEDEVVAAQNLQRILEEVSPMLQVVRVIQSIEESVEFFQQVRPLPDICFMDIHLADGLAFHIFEKVSVDCPVIFTTAYDQYALQAFKTNCIDYLLKPIDKAELRRALDKADRLVLNASRLQELMNLLQPAKCYRSSFLIPFRDQLMPLPVEEVAYFALHDKTTCIETFDGRHFALDQSLDSIMEQLDPQLFYRANRQYVVSHRAIKEITLWPISKLALRLCVETPERIIISKANVRDFKDWFTR